ncbi:myelin-oligodendrocyte glycoprotein-like [Cyprinodon tularosa]|uniref:myelin-oligodendrocyte glycoprotein-like n=1 Tax=Cyprinodon tularosa TaxID=77115 RepID=UPI0018E2635D|nr:myelin-oligodendrocyte glycoprotein-like [Cyprinodon tularosa]
MIFRMELIGGIIRIFLLVIFGCSIVDTPGQKTIKAKPGQDVILPCKVTDHQSVTGVEWTREDLKEEHVLLYKNNKDDPDGQHPSYKDRVDLQDREMKDGDVSVVLKNVTPNDNGIYECRLEREIFDPTPICSIQLVVLPPGDKDERKNRGGKND